MKMHRTFLLLPIQNTSVVRKSERKFPFCTQNHNLDVLAWFPHLVPSPANPRRLLHVPTPHLWYPASDVLAAWKLLLSASEDLHKSRPFL